eukprot:84860-Prymnesium_polylepis.1
MVAVVRNLRVVEKHREGPVVGAYFIEVHQRLDPVPECIHMPPAARSLPLAQGGHHRIGRALALK